ncbi:hypothetical protein BE221DRAFT_22090 [Ostreococcus tauri]|uniref:Uncharacterized protein n=1 Tax=Ostreococcus tauri TaxID=70448 RepID=A0A1Y5I2P4_OSTTA|nr:hypothetical protein BE221DRAFT_22090 [Ostreococcus tauri]
MVVYHMEATQLHAMASHDSSKEHARRSDTSNDIIRTPGNLMVLREKFEPSRKSLASKDVIEIARELHALTDKVNDMHSEMMKLKGQLLDALSDITIDRLKPREDWKSVTPTTARSPSRLRPSPKIAERVSALLNGHQGALESSVFDRM